MFLPLLLCLAGCATSKGAASEDSVSGDRGAIVIQGKEVGSSVVQSIRNRIPTTKIVESRTGRCPHIVFRSEKSIRNQGDPTVYIDGTRMIDTCALFDLSATDIDRIEIYPSGITPHAEIQRNPYGLILIFRGHR